MTREEAIRHQKEIAEHFYLHFWYATTAEKCCDVFPKVMRTESMFDPQCYLECEVCGSRNTKTYLMPWEAIEAWNNGERTEGQFKLW